jgi:ubiquinone/menaquinone biosynthesis C-methylase UbiE
MVRKPARTTWNLLLDDRPTSNVPRIKFSFMFSDQCGINTASRILDIGCGTGSYTQLVDREGCIGIDLDINGLIVAKKHCSKSDFILCSATNLPFRDNVFDYACMWGVFEELPSGLETHAMREIRRILVGNGTYLLSMYTDHILSKLFDPAFLFGVRHYNVKRFMGLLSDMGFSVTRYTIRGQLHTLVAIFLVYFYKHILRKKEDRVKRFFEQKSMQEIERKENGIVYTFIAASKSCINSTPAAY